MARENIDQEEQSEFEEMVRTVARALWPSARSGGARNIDGVEHDGVFFAFEVVHCIEATVSRRKEKAEHDAKKLKLAIDKWTGSDDRLAKGWFITKEDPTTEQTRAIRKIDPRITAISFKRFRSRLIDIYLYDQLRTNMRFGSSENPNEDEEPNSERYVAVEFQSLDGGSRGTVVSLHAVIEQICEGRNVAIVGDYGIGKSMNMREIYLRLVTLAKDNRSINVPIHINLRDHWGQKSPSAALTQHAEEIGYGDSQQLIAAWRAGFVHVLLDGFDEVASPGWSGDIVGLRSSRRRAVELVRKFVEQTPKSAAVVVAGRRHYFDSLSELRDAMFGNGRHSVYELTEFSEKQIEKYLRNRNVTHIPSFLPARPLLLGYLAAGGLLNEIQAVSDDADMSVAASWDWLLTKLSKREAKIDSGLNGESVRQIVEALAAQARTKSSPIGPVSQREITEAFKKVRGQEPSEAEQAILQRLPGLARDPNFEEGTRSFVDIDLAIVAQARYVSQLALDPYGVDESNAKAWANSLGPLGVEVAAYQYSFMAPNRGHLDGALKHANRRSTDGPGRSAAAGDGTRAPDRHSRIRAWRHGSKSYDHR